MAYIRVMFNEQEVSKHNLEKDVYTIGRVQECDIHIDNIGISRNHARIVRDGSGFRIEDLNSSNGTFLNGNKVKSEAIKEGDKLLVGKYVIEYHAGEGDPVAAPQTPKNNRESVSALDSGDGLFTMSMDGDAIRKRIEEMHKQKENAETENTEAAAEPAPQAATTDKPADQAKSSANRETMMESREKMEELEKLKKSQKTMKLAIIGIAIVAVAAVAVLLLVLK